MSVAEPSTLISDYVLSVLCFVLGARLARAAAGRRSVAAWAMAFFATGAAAFFGGTVHGFPALPGSGALWKASIVSLGFMSLSMASGSVRACVAPRHHLLLLRFLVFKFVVFVAFATQSDDFRLVIADYAPVMVAVAVLHAANLRRRRAADRWILGGLALSLAGAGLQQANVSLHRFFNHNDLYHAVQALAMLAFYRGAGGLDDAPSGA